MLDHCRQRARPCRSARLARSGTPHLVAHRAIHRYVPTRTTVLRAKAIASTAAARPPPDQRCGQISIAPAAPSVPYPPRFRALALFRRRPPERVVGIVGAGVRKPAQGRKSRWVGHRRCRGLYGASGGGFASRSFSTAAGLDAHNFSVMARALLKGGFHVLSHL